MKKIVKIFIGIFIGVIMLIILSPVLTWVLFFYETDKYEKDRPLRDEIYKIPENIEYNEPKRGDEYYSNKPETIFIEDDYEKSIIDFELFDTMNRSGFYHYYIWLNNIDKGTVYLKAFEYNTNSQFRIGDTDINITEFHNIMKKYGPRFFVVEAFTGLFLGGEGRYYLARFELWYRSEDDDLDKLILTKLYIIRDFSLD